MTESVETVVIGGGQAGLAMSYCLRALGHEHVVLERARVAERWRTQRWDSLRFQFPNRTLELPGFAYTGRDPEAFSHKDDIVRFIEDYAASFHAPIRTGVNVESLRAGDEPSRYTLRTDHGVLSARNVVIATGPYQLPRVPETAAALPPDVVQVHASDYRNPGALPDGSILVVGSGASGCQIADELLEAGRRVYMSVGRHRRFPRRYRGRDFLDWWRLLGRYDHLVDDRPEGRSGSAPPVITGVNGGYDIDLRRSASKGLRLVGHLAGVSEGRATLTTDVEQTLRDADEAFVAFRRDVDDCVHRTGIDAPPQQGDEGPAAITDGVEPPEVVDLRAESIRSVIWATGYAHAFDWIGPAVLDERRNPVHRRGVTSAPGLYFLGLSWLYKAKSAFLSGVGEDAAFLAERIAGGA